MNFESHCEVVRPFPDLIEVLKDIARTHTKEIQQHNLSVEAEVSTEARSFTRKGDPKGE